VKLLDLGTCGLHTVHNAFRAGVEASGWDLGSLFSSLTWLFKDSPARREDFTNLTGKFMDVFSTLYLMFFRAAVKD
jgi:hypothetical protein